MKTLSIAAFNRPEYLAQTVAALNACDLHCFDHAVLSIDASDKTGQIIVEASKLKLPLLIYTQPQHVGLNANTLAALRHAFAQSQYNLHIEEDVVVSPDTVRYMLWAASLCTFVELFSRRSGAADPGACHFHPHFNPWGWACSSDTFRRFIEPGWESRIEQHPNHLWDLALHEVMERHGLTALRPHLSRSKHVGRTGTTQSEAYYDQYLSQFNFCSDVYEMNYYITD